VCGFLELAWALSQWRRNAQRDTQRVFEQLDLVRSELLIMKEVMHDAAHRKQPITNEIRMPQAPATTAVRGYEIATRMARNGASKDELIRSAGITPHEAELLIKLHSRDVRPATFTASAAAAKATPDAGLVGRQPRATVAAAPIQQREAVKAPSVPPAARKAPAVRSRLVAVG
jgi:hypothetical protein